MPRTYEERIDELTKKLEQMQALKKELEQKARVQERKDRTHRLIQIGAVMEQACGEAIDPEMLANYLSSKVRSNNGEERTVIEIQRHHYMRTKERIEQERAGATASNDTNNGEQEHQ